MFETPDSYQTAILNAQEPDTNAQHLASVRQQSLTKPPGALGRLEEIAIWLAGWQKKERPVIDHVQISVFAGNHGITERGVSPFPAEVTAQMVENFAAGGAAINTFAETFKFELNVLPLDLDHPVNDWTKAPAMTEAECLEAVNAGAEAIDNKTDLLVLGEMGIGNTSSAAAIAAAVFGGTGRDWAGPGTGLSPEGVASKAAIIDEGLLRHRTGLTNSFEILRHLGGRELAAIAGALVAARTRCLPVILDGYVVTAAAATLYAINPNALNHCLAGHVSVEPAHQLLLQKLQMKPLLDLGMRLGEGTGAALAANIVRAAAASHSHMATFEEASVSGKS